jgi:cellulose synthase/poly-beta-1,6-N-acetylglucosamine synthase-like glycosyltransferase
VKDFTLNRPFAQAFHIFHSEKPLRVHSSRRPSFLMPPITALLHAANDSLRLGRALETIYPCDEIVVVDHNSTDATVHVAREYGARVVSAENNATAADYLNFAAHDWIFCLAPNEALTEALAASLFEWRNLPANKMRTKSGAVFLLEETKSGWQEISTPQTRLVPRNWKQWENLLAVNDAIATPLEGKLLRFTFP